MSQLILYIFLTMSLSFLCSLLEATILSVTPAYISVLSQNSPRSGRLLHRLKHNIDKSLSAILTLNTFANTMGPTSIGILVGELFDSKYGAVFSIALSFGILIISEIIPKTLGAVYWRNIAPFASYIITLLVFLLTPMVLLTRQVSKLINPAGGSNNSVSREEIQAVADMGHDQGTLHPQENKIIQNILCLKSIRVNDILTPRSVLFAFQQSMTITEIMDANSQLPFSRIPIYNRDLDDITGYVLRYRLVKEASDGNGHQMLKDIAKDIDAFPDTADVANILNELIVRKEHIFLIVDEYGGTAGIVTMEDVIETLLGVEIVDELDSVTDMRKHAKALWEKRQQNFKLTDEPT